jgi:MoaA/NifB/PqqE/SkfB family radical SAM enzyme
MSDTFCVLPWIGASSITGTGAYRPCCVYNPSNDAHWSDTIENNNSKFDDLRKDLLNGVRRKECTTCWNHEDLGKFSRRQSVNYKFQDYIEEIKTNTTKTGSTKITPFYFDMKMSSLCNLGCRMCAPGISSVLEAEVKNNPNENWLREEYRFPANVGTWEQNAFDQIQKQNVKELKFTGGEPFANPKIFEFLESLKNKKEISLKFITNGLLLKQKHFKLLNKFKDLHISISCDGIEDVYDYIRWPGKWKNFEKAYNTIKDNSNMNVVCVVSAYNIFKLNNIIDYFADTEFHMTPLITPNYMYPFVQGKNYNLDPNKHKDMPSVIATKKPFDQHLYDMFVEQTKIRDKLRKQNFWNVQN